VTLVKLIWHLFSTPNIPMLGGGIHLISIHIIKHFEPKENESSCTEECIHIEPMKHRHRHENQTWQWRIDSIIILKWYNWKYSHVSYLWHRQTPDTSSIRVYDTRSIIRNRVIIFIHKKSTYISKVYNNKVNIFYSIYNYPINDKNRDALSNINH
jgi:hypothetical protein